MKLLSLIIFILLFTGCVSEQQNNPPAIKVISVNTKVFTFFTNGKKDDFGQEIKVAFFKDYILFEKPVLHHKTQTSSIDLSKAKDGDTIIDNSEPDMTIEKITHQYYVFKKGGKKGVFYDEDRGKTEEFSVDTLFIESNLGKENEDGISSELGNPIEVKKQGKRRSEKYYNLKKEIGIDTVLRFYDDALKDIPFSISKKLDRERNSKLTKSVQIVTPPSSIQVKEFTPFKVQFLTQMALITERCSKSQLEKFKIYFDKYQKGMMKTGK